MALDSRGRPWARYSIDLPEPARVVLMRALELAKLSGEATNEIEAIEALAASYTAEKEHEAEQQARRTPADRYTALLDSGFRCLACGTSRSLECHHILPRSQGGPDGSENLAVLCAECHSTVTSGRWVWSQVAAELGRLKEERRREVESAGFAMRTDNRWRLDKAVADGGRTVPAGSKD